MRIRYCIASVVLCLAPLTAAAQVELIVRLGPAADPVLAAALDGGASKSAGTYAALFSDVSGVRAVFPADDARKQGADALRAYVLNVPDSTTLATLLAHWEAVPGVAYAQPNYRYRLDAVASPDPRLDSLDHLTVIRAREAWAVTTGSATVRVGIVDTGLYLDHPDLAAQVWINPGEDLNKNGVVDAGDLNGVDDDGNGYVDDLRGYDFVDRVASVEQGDYLVRDPDPSEDDLPGGGRGHGTLVAGVVGSAYDNGEGGAGVAPGARLVPLRAFGADGIAEDDDVAAAIVYAADLGVDVVNLSFGDVFISTLLHESIRYAVAKGTIVVASAGNVGGDGPHYPSDFPEVISVAWLDRDGDGIAARGTYGVGIDLGAPGSAVYTTLMPASQNGGTDAWYGRRSGSSLAAPMVSGAAALLRSLDPSLTPAAVRDVMTATAHDIEEAGWDHLTGAGRLDVAAALTRALPARVEVTSPGHNEGLSGDQVAVVGSAIDPAFAAYTVQYAAGDEDANTRWQLIAGPLDHQVRRDTLAHWSIQTLPEGLYTLRLAVALRTGRTVEDRRRVFIDRSEPQVHVRLLDAGLVGAYHGVIADVSTDDLTSVRMDVGLEGQAYTVFSGREARRHGVAWADESTAGGLAHVALTVTNAAGFATTHAVDLAIPQRAMHGALFDEEVLDVPHGYLLPRAVDFDRDGLLEIVMNQYQAGWIGDTLAFYEWTGEGFSPAATLVSNVIPRDAGDSDGDGKEELLTQVSGATLLLEQEGATDYPFTQAFLDTTGLSDPFAEGATFGALLTDLDGDGRGEILAHNTQQWRLLEYQNGEYADVLRLENPTSVSGSEVERNAFQEPRALVDDFDGDGRTDLLVGDSDGDWILYEQDGDDRLRIAWTHETARYNAGSRMAAGDLDGDGRPECVTYTENWQQNTVEGEQEPGIGLYYFWDAEGDDGYVLRDSLPVAGNLSRHGSVGTADFDGDGIDEVVVVHPPFLYVLARQGGDRWHPIFMRDVLHQGALEGMRSITQVTADFDGDGTPEVLASGADERLHRYVFNQAGRSAPMPQWIAAFATDASHVRLSWAPGLDSVSVYHAGPTGTYDLVVTTAETTWTDTTTALTRYALKGWTDGVASMLSPVRSVRPHAPALVMEVSYPAPSTVALRFSEPLDAASGAQQFVLGGSTQPGSLLLGQGGRAIILRFSDIPRGEVTLRWTALRDAEGTPVGQDAVQLRFPERSDGTLIVRDWTILDRYSVRLTFNEALEPQDATDVSNYRLHPSGIVAEAVFDGAIPQDVVLRVEGRPLGATGQETRLEVASMRGASGSTLAAEGRVILMAEAAADLSGVYVYPNPYRAAQHAPRVTIAGLPASATVRILSIQGTLVRVLEDQDGIGGLAWDLTDGRGAAVPSGVYLIRVEADGEAPVLRKAAVIR